MKESERPSKSKVTSLGKSLSAVEKNRIMELAYKANPAARTICEIGPGRFCVYDWAKNKGLTYIAIDQTDITLELVKSPNRFIVAKVPPLPDVSADIFILMNILEHMNGPKQANELISQIWQSLNFNGLIVIEVPDIRFMKQYFWSDSVEHNYATSLQRIILLLEEHNFEIVCKEMICGPLRLPLGYLIALPSWLLRTFYTYFLPKRYGSTVYKMAKGVSAVVIGRKK